MSTEFQIDQSIYCSEVITASIEAFSDIADIQYVNGVLTIKGDSLDENKEIFNEFFNYTLSLINS
tara:strand:+ start:172 stop:366 length:195 start_codon:yes stop_codon:yes gene_type:complete